jgi:hypothetical protein
MTPAFRPHADPPRTLRQRLERLNCALEALRRELKDGISRAVSAAIAEAIGDGLRALLGVRGNTLGYHPDREHSVEDRDWHDSEGQGFWHQEHYADPDEEAAAQPSAGYCRWREVLGSALLTGLWWGKRQHSRRPVLSTLVVAAAAGILTYLAGPALTSAAVAVASAATLLLTAETADSVVSDLARLCG